MPCIHRLSLHCLKPQTTCFYLKLVMLNYQNEIPWKCLKGQKSSEIGKNDDGFSAIGMALKAQNHCTIYLTLILPVFLHELYCESPANLTVYFLVPSLFRFLILNVALPLALVFAVYFFLLTVKVSFFLAIAFPFTVFKSNHYFFNLFVFLECFLRSIHLGLFLVDFHLDC